MVRCTNRIAVFVVDEVVHGNHTESILLGKLLRESLSIDRRGIGLAGKNLVTSQKRE